MRLINFNQLIEMDVNQSNLAEPNTPSNDFNTIIGYIEDIVIDDSFQVIYNNTHLIFVLLSINGTIHFSLGDAN